MNQIHENLLSDGHGHGQNHDSESQGNMSEDEAGRHDTMLNASAHAFVEVMVRYGFIKHDASQRITRVVNQSIHSKVNTIPEVRKLTMKTSQSQ